MSATPILDQARNLTKIMQGLLDDPHPGLFTWQDAVHQTAARLNKVINGDDEFEGEVVKPLSPEHMAGTRNRLAAAGFELTPEQFAMKAKWALEGMADFLRSKGFIVPNTDEGTFALMYNLWLVGKLPIELGVQPPNRG